MASLLCVDAATLSLIWSWASGTFPWQWRIDQLPGAVMGQVRLPQFLFAIILGLALFGCYRSGDYRRDARALVGASGFGIGLAMWGELWSGALLPLFGFLLVLWGVVALGLVMERRLVDRVVRVVRPEGQNPNVAVVIGSARLAARLIDHPSLGENPSCHLAAFFDPQAYTPKNAPAALADLIRERGIDTMILGGKLTSQMFAVVLDVALASGCQVFALPRVPMSSTVLPKVLWRNGYPIVELTRPGLMGAKLLVKRTIDVVVAAAALVLLAPLLAIIALIVRATSPGPALFRQTRIGQGGRTFTILKFRTMVADAERQREALQNESVYRDGRLFKVVDDPRVTPVGAFLRRTSLDELPQLWNVLRGDMSLVGPRPPLPTEVALYQGHHYARFDVKPGVTGPWQVSGRNSIRDFETVIRLETTYIRRWSLWLDLELLWKTVPAVLSRRGAH